LPCRLRFSWKDTQAQNLLPECILTTLKTALKIEPKIAHIRETARNIAKSLKFHPQTLLLSVLQGTIICFKLYRNKYFFFQIGRYFFIILYGGL